MASVRRTILRGMEKKAVTRAADGLHNRKMRRTRDKKNAK